MGTRITYQPTEILMQLTINGESRSFDMSITVEQLLGEIGIDVRKVAVERNLEIVPK